MNIYTYDDILFPLPENHRFPLQKYSLLREFLQKQTWLRSGSLVKPIPAQRRDLQLAHGDFYIDKVTQGTLSTAEIRRIGLPWSLQLVERCLHSAGATIAAAADALQNGLGISLGGGTHHACRHEGQGYCIFNDTIIAARVEQRAGRIKQALVIDCDVHQGNGSAEITQDDSSIFTFSIHGEKNFPFRKILGDIDIGLPDDTGDELYLRALQSGLERALAHCEPDLIFYLAGADVHENDRLGRLKLTANGMAARDRLIFSTVKTAGRPLVLTLAGGYGRHLPTMVALQAETIRLALEMLAPAGLSTTD